MSRSEVWFVRPRDPLVLGDGRGPIPFFARRAWPLPLPQTVAGMVRAQFVRAGHDVDRGHALSLLNGVRIEGPFLAQKEKERFTPWVFAPADARRDRTGRLYRDRLLDVGPGEGALWPEGLAPPAVLVPLGKTEDGHKTQDASPFWPLADAIDWALDGDAPRVDPGGKKVQGERRVHVKIDDGTWTAEPGMLFSSAGGRFAEDFGLLLRVTAPAFDTGAGPRWPGERDMVVLGGESRPSFRERVLSEDAYPSYGQHQERYDEALARVTPATGLRLQLLTHACLHDSAAESGALACLPSWLAGGEGAHPLVPGLRLRLRALRLSRPIAVSGWDLQGGNQREGAPRKVRRLVPAGTVYYLDLVDVPEAKRAQELARAWAGLFAAPLDPQAGGVDEEQHLSRPAQDGMGLCLPGLFSRGSR